MSIYVFLSDSLLISESDLEKFSSTAPYRYKVYDIPKRNGKGFRTIAHPSKELKLIQRLCVQYLENKLYVNDAATGYRRGLSIKDNAAAHSKNKYLLKMDFEDFFPSIKPLLFFYICKQREIKFTVKEKAFLRYILFRKSRGEDVFRLSIGAPSSPLISNFVMSTFDEIVLKYCINNKITYTRYADDLAFSTNVRNSLFDVPKTIQERLHDATRGTIKVNSSKTVFSSRKHNRHITGVTLTNDGLLSLGRKKKREISSLVHKFSIGTLEQTKISNLQGQLSFAYHIEPEFLIRLQKKYGQAIIDKIKGKTDK
ncbi:retron St85 family RNA-directed DNA polymerase [Glaciecola sp. 33A]|jgi:RNA-directed DNA polymerase|uniref:retron St85 family RNA-directed DNA polymerase n=1 Tax=Glaciecola sp. 33A TaxID=2057807 RepID=UPI000C331667|nr:retron St85 family RNA-directed DNA polymerase [Glaciecola sp. 33A]PKI01484.1 RNA-directed DNA polymerase [Glaciecola sp. 33A]